MSKFLRTAAVVVGAVALVATGVGAAAGVATIATVAAAALSVGAQLTAKKPSLSGSPTAFKIDLNAPAPYLVGRTLHAGYIVHRATYGSKNAYQSFIASISGGGPIDSIEAFQVDRVTTTFSGGAAIGFYAGWMWLDTQLGATPESDALAGPVGAIPEWGAASKLSGHAAFLWTLKFDTKGKKYTSGPPLPGVIAKGVKVYDPRLDSTYPGGSGTHRVDDEATWEWSDNPWLHGLTWALGRHQNGKRVLGVGVPVDGIDVPAYVEAANVADANEWPVGGVVYSTDDKWNVLKLFAQAGGGEPTRSGALVSCIVNTPRVALDTIRAGDIVGDASVAATQSRRERINGVVPRFRSEDHGWEVIPADEVRVSTYVAEDGGERTKEIEYPLVQILAQVAQLAAYDIVNAREFGPISLPLKIRWVGFKPGDCLTIDVPELNLIEQDAIVIGRALDPQSGVVTLTLKSETSAKHAFALGTTTTAPPTPDLSTPDAGDVEAPEPAAWNLVGATLSSATGSIPALVVEGSTDDPNAEAVIFEYRIDGATDWTGGTTEPATIERKELTSVTPSTDYEVAISYRVRGVVGDRLILGPVTTGSLSIAGGEPLVSNLAADGAVGAAAVTWRNPNVPFDHLDLYRGTTSTFGAATVIASGIVDGLGQVMTFNNTGLSAGTYYYWVRAYDPALVAATPIGPDSAIVT